MTRVDNKWVKELFDATAIEWTSTAFADRVLYVPVSMDRKVSSRCESVLSIVELRQADRFVRAEHRAEFVQRRAFRRYCGALVSGSQRPLSQIIFSTTKNGRPYLPDRPELWFSFSSCRLGFVGAWSSTHGLGVDIEDPATEAEADELAQFYYTGPEARTIWDAGPTKHRTFFRLWSLKEAALKSIGEGLPFGLDAFEFDKSSQIIRAPDEYGGPDRFNAHIFDRRDVCAALVARSLETGTNS